MIGETGSIFQIEFSNLYLHTLYKIKNKLHLFKDWTCKKLYYVCQVLLTESQKIKKENWDNLFFVTFSQFCETALNNILLEIEPHNLHIIVPFHIRTVHDIDLDLKDDLFIRIRHQFHVNSVNFL